MNDRKSIEADIYTKGSVNREHLFAFLKLLPTNDMVVLRSTARVWLQRLHDDPYYSKVNFPTADGEYGAAVDRILADLTSYGRLTHETIIGAPPVDLPTLESGV